MKINVLLTTIDDVRSFVNTASAINKDVTVYGKNYVVDGKSIMGIFSLDLSNSIIVEVDTEDSEMINSAFSKFIIE